MGLAVFSRMYLLDSVPLGLNQDEAVNGYDAYSLLLTLRDHHGNYLPPMLQSYNDWASPALTYISVPFVALFGLSTWTIRFVTAFFGVMSVFLMFNLCRLIFKNFQLAALASFVLAVSPFAIHLSRWAIPPSIIPFFLLLSLNSALYLVRVDSLKHKIFWSVSIAFSFGALTYSYPTMKLFAPILLLGLVVIHWQKMWKFLVPTYLLFLFLVSPIYWQTLTKPEVNARFETQSLAIVGENYFPGSITRYGEYFLPYFMFGHGDSNRMQQAGEFSLLPEALSLLFYVGLVVVVYELYKSKQNNKQILPFQNQKTLLFLMLAVLLSPVAVSLTKDHFMLLRAVQLPVLSIIVAMFGVLILKNLEEIYKRIIIGTLTIVIALSFLHFSGYYFTSYADEYQYKYQNGTEQVFKYLQANENQFDQVYFDGINQAYIYYLFYNKVNPKTISDNSDFSKAIGKYKFFPVSIQGKTIRLFKTNDGTTLYQIQQLQPRVWQVTS